MSASVSPDYTFASDNTAGIAPEAFAAMQAANVGAVPSYGDDAWTARAQRLIAEVFETECEVFFVASCTAANALALGHLCRSFHSIIAHHVAHIDTDECGATGFFSGGAKIATVGGANGKIAPAELEAALGRGHSVHSSAPRVVSITQATEFGTLYTPEEIRAISSQAKAHGLAVHLDGARFANAAAALQARGISPADFTWRAGVDVMSFGGTKNGMNMADVIVFFDRPAARDFAYRVKQAGQLVSKQRFRAAQWCAMLESGAWLKHAAHANAMAARLSGGLRALGLKLVHETEANGVFVELPPSIYAAMEARGWRFHLFIGERGYRLMTSWQTQAETVDRFVAELGAELKARA